MTLTVKDSAGTDVPLSTYTDGATEQNPRHSIITAEGAGATIGTTTDAAIITSANGSLSGKIRGLIALFLDAIGTAADAAVTTGVAGSISGKMRGLVGHVDTIDTQTGNISGSAATISNDVTNIRTATGSTLDAAVVTNANGSLSGKLRGIIVLFLDGIGASGDAAASAGGTGTLGAKLRVVSDVLGAQADAAPGAGIAGTVSGKLRMVTDTLGDKADVAVTTNTSGTLSAKLRGIVALLAAAIDTTNLFIRSQIVPHTSGGLTNYHVVSLGSVNNVSVKGGPGQVYGWNIYNNAAYPVYVKFHNTAGAVTAGTGVVHNIGVAAGGGNNWSTDIGMAFATGIGISIVKGIADTDATVVVASDCVVDVKYK